MYLPEIILYSNEIIKQTILQQVLQLFLLLLLIIMIIILSFLMILLTTLHFWSNPVKQKLYKTGIFTVKSRLKYWKKYNHQNWIKLSSYTKSERNVKAIKTTRLKDNETEDYYCISIFESRSEFHKKEWRRKILAWQLLFHQLCETSPPIYYCAQIPEVETTTSAPTNNYSVPSNGC